MISRRRVLSGLSALIAAPAVIRVADLMAIKPVPAYLPGGLVSPAHYITGEAVSVGDVLVFDASGAVVRADWERRVNSPIAGVCRSLVSLGDRMWAEVERNGIYSVSPSGFIAVA